MIKKTYKITGMDCKACAQMIELDLEDIGVTAKCDFDSEHLAVEFDTAKMSEEKIFETVKKSGYGLTSHTS